MPAGRDGYSIPLNLFALSRLCFWYGSLDYVIRFFLEQTHSVPHCSYLAALVRDQAPPTRDATSQSMGHCEGKLGRGWRTSGKDSDEMTQQGGRGPTKATGARGGYFNAFIGRPEAKTSNVIITGILQVCHRPALVLFDLGSTYSYISTYFFTKFDLLCEYMSVHVHVSNSVGDPLVVDQVYQSYLISIYGYDTQVDMIILDMVKFDVIFGMIQLFPHWVILDCYAKTMTLAILGRSSIVWQGLSGYYPNKVIFYIGA